MALFGVVAELALVVGAMLATATLVIIGPRRFAEAVSDSRRRFEAMSVPLAVLVTVLFVRWSTQEATIRLSWRVIGSNLTPLIFEVERTLFGNNPVEVLQAFQTEWATAFFVFIYIYGYAFLLLFPFVAYFALERTEWLSTLVLAYTVNYAIGLVFYVLVIAYGPRNFDPVVFEGLLYQAFPRAGYLTHSVNQPINVFPSLHTSLSMTVLFLAWHTREEYPLWVPISGVIAISVALSTMYLGIHWLSDVVAGTLLAAFAVYVGVSYTVEGILASTRLYVVSRLGRPGGE